MIFISFPEQVEAVGDTFYGLTVMLLSVLNGEAFGRGQEPGSAAGRLDSEIWQPTIPTSRETVASSML